MEVKTEDEKEIKVEIKAENAEEEPKDNIKLEVKDEEEVKEECKSEDEDGVHVKIDSFDSILSRYIYIAYFLCVYEFGVSHQHAARLSGRTVLPFFWTMSILETVNQYCQHLQI